MAEPKTYRDGVSDGIFCACQHIRLYLLQAIDRVEGDEALKASVIRADVLQAEVKALSRLSRACQETDRGDITYISSEEIGIIYELCDFTPGDKQSKENP